MPRIAYVNGRYLPFADAKVHIEDRGYQFADGVYEVVLLLGGLLVNDALHLNRLQRSLRELKIAAPMSEAALRAVWNETARRNRVRGDGILYTQITRGVARRDHAFPSPEVRPSLIVTAKGIEPARFTEKRERGIAVISVPDIRWGRCDIKSVSLLPNVLAKQAAREQGAYEAWLVDEDGNVTEGSSTTAWIVTAKGEAVTRPLDEHILPGVTREALKRALAEHQIPVVERRFSLAEAKSASEAFLTASSFALLPIVSIDGVKLGGGKPGPVSRRFYEIYRSTIASQ